MSRRPYDKTSMTKRGSESVSHPIWDDRIAKMVAFLKDKPRTAVELFRDLSQKKKWPYYYSVNVLAASDIAGAVQYRTSDCKWYVGKKVLPP